MNPLLEAIHDLNRSIKEQSSSVQLSQSEIETMLQELKSNTAATTESARSKNDRDPGTERRERRR
jgi:methyl-accepting chemotaxis protein